MTRIPMVPEDSDNPIVKDVFDKLKQGWGCVLNLYRVLAWSPELVKGWRAFAWTLRFETKASRKLRELLIIRIASLLGAKYEYEHHLSMAIDEGITEDQIAALSDWSNSSLFEKEQKAVLALADDLALTPGASEETMAVLRALFSERDTVELVVTGSFYCGVARIINSVQLELEPNHAELRPRN